MPSQWTFRKSSTRTNNSTQPKKQVSRISGTFFFLLDIYNKICIIHASINKTNLKFKVMYTDNYPFYYDPYMDPHMYEKLTEEELHELSKQAIVLIIATIAAIVSTGILAGVLHLLKVI